MYIVTSGLNPHDDYIEHYGVKGMRWGIHRYRNADGSLTEGTKKRMSRIEKSKLRSKIHTRRMNKALDTDNRNNLINAYRSAKINDTKGEKQYLKNVKENEKLRDAIKSGAVKAGKDFVVDYAGISNYLHPPTEKDISIWRKYGADYVYTVLNNSDKIPDKEVYDFFVYRRHTASGHIRRVSDMYPRLQEYKKAKEYYDKDKK